MIIWAGALARRLYRPVAIRYVTICLVWVLADQGVVYASANLMYFSHVRLVAKKSNVNIYSISGIVRYRFVPSGSNDYDAGDPIISAWS
jgi:hypothetical protein